MQKIQNDIEISVDHVALEILIKIWPNKITMQFLSFSDQTICFMMHIIYPKSVDNCKKSMQNRLAFVLGAFPLINIEHYAVLKQIQPESVFLCNFNDITRMLIYYGYGHLAVDK